MTPAREGLYRGGVIHTRIHPVRHKFRYRVFALLLEVGRIDAASRRLRLFSHNRFNLFSLFDRDHGDGTGLEPYLRDLAGSAGRGECVDRFMMLCYPRIAGYAFNPLTVYYGLDPGDRIRLMIYEVNNTFGQRQTYVVPVATEANEDVLLQSCPKSLYVSPFNSDRGSYSFHITRPEENLVVGVALRDEDGPVMKAHFRGCRAPLTDAALLRALARTGWMTVKVIGAIHWQALRLWLKGMRVRPRPRTARKSVHIQTVREEPGRS